MAPQVHSSNFYPSAENLFHQYRSYYPDYHHHHHHPHLNSPTPTYVTNGFLSYDSYGLPASVVGTKEEKWQDNKYYGSYPASYPQSHVSL